MKNKREKAKEGKKEEVSEIKGGRGSREEGKRI